MAVYLILGDIGFGQLSSPASFTAKVAASYAEHQVIEGKPLLQYTGDNLDEVNLSFYFHASFCDPQAVWDDIREMAAAHQSLELSQGNGLLLGRFVITEAERTTNYAAEDGTLYAFECRLALKEYVDPDPLGTKKKAQQASATGLTGRGSLAKAVKAAGNRGALLAGGITAGAAQINLAGGLISSVASGLSGVMANAGPTIDSIRSTVVSITDQVSPVIQRARLVAAGVGGAASEIKTYAASMGGFSSDLTHILSGLPGSAGVLSAKMAALNSRISRQVNQITTLAVLASAVSYESQIRAKMITRMLPR